MFLLDACDLRNAIKMKIVIWNVASWVRSLLLWLFPPMLCCPSQAPTVRNIDLRHKNLHEYFRNVLKADLVCLQETKVTKLTREVACVPGYESFWSCSQAKPGYSGVATFAASPQFSPVAAAVDCLPGEDNRDLNTEGRSAAAMPFTTDTSCWV